MQPEGDFIRNSKVKVKSSRNKMEETDIEEMEKK